jgi:hypothetical protein
VLNVDAISNPDATTSKTLTRIHGVGADGIWFREAGRAESGCLTIAHGNAITRSAAVTIAAPDQTAIRIHVGQDLGVLFGDTVLSFESKFLFLTTKVAIFGHGFNKKPATMGGLMRGHFRLTVQLGTDSGRRLARFHVHFAAVVAEVDGAIGHRKEAVVLGLLHVRPGVILRATLGDDDAANRDRFAIVFLDATPFGVRIAAVAD